MNYSIRAVNSFSKELKKLSKKYKNLKNDYKMFLDLLSTSNPKELGIFLTNNCYKIRIKNSDNHKGKSAGYRIIYLLIEDEDIVLLSIYSKSDVANISESEIDKKIIEAIEVL